MVLPFESMHEILKCDIQMKAIEQYKVVITLESMDDIPMLVFVYQYNVSIFF